ncbi:hypothetical protein RB195_006848 [Necator americanus]|uniref:carbonic anhydrase n=1 Tax=Necator americanus TaxID=51031 RepID=A0ABR1BXV0_NECAM
MIQVATDRDVLANLKDAFLTTNSSGDTAQFVYSPAELLPNDTMTFFRYEGSLTTPPCTEGVTWIVLAEPTYVLEDAIVFLRQHLTTEGAYLKHNWRKTQTLNNRTIYLNKNGVKSLETNILYASCTILLITFEKAVALQRHRYVCRFDFPVLGFLFLFAKKGIYLRLTKLYILRILFVFCSIVFVCSIVCLHYLLSSL